MIFFEEDDLNGVENKAGLYKSMKARGGHPNVLTILETHVLPPTPWTAAPYVHGESLFQALRGGSLPADAKTGTVTHLAQALRRLYTTSQIAHMGANPGNTRWDRSVFSLHHVLGDDKRRVSADLGGTCWRGRILSATRAVEATHL